MRDAHAYAVELFGIWHEHDDCVEQITAHMESEGFSDWEIGVQLEALGLW